MDLQIVAKKTNQTIWTFDHEHNNTIEEPLCNGTDKLLDWYFKVFNKGKEPVEGDKLVVWVNTEPFINPITHFDLIKTDSYGSTYKDHFSGRTLWLCPWLQSYFGNVPEVLHVIIEKYEELHPEILKLIDEIVEEEALFFVVYKNQKIVDFICTTRPLAHLPQNHHLPPQSYQAISATPEAPYQQTRPFPIDKQHQYPNPLTLLTTYCIL